MDWPFGKLQPGAYDVVSIDVAWAWSTWSAAGAKKSPSSKYKTMTIAEAAQLPVRALVRPGGVVWAWATWPMLPQQLDVFQNAWGLTYKTGGSWAKRTRSGKLRLGPGHILRSVCEPWLIGVSGNGGGPRGPSCRNLIETLDSGHFDGLAREHSRKPDEAYRLIEALAPNAERAEVYARTRRKGWHCYGDELDKFT